MRLDKNIKLKEIAARVRYMVLFVTCVITLVSVYGDFVSVTVCVNISCCQTSCHHYLDLFPTIIFLSSFANFLNNLFLSLK